MKENVGTVDRTVRMVFGVALFFTGWLGPDGALGLVLMVIGGVLIATGLMSHCPIYSVVGKSTVEEPDVRGH